MEAEWEGREETGRGGRASSGAHAGWPETLCLSF